MPLIGNGDIFSYEDVDQALQGGVTTVMLARAAPNPNPNPSPNPSPNSNPNPNPNPNYLPHTHTHTHVILYHVLLLMHAQSILCMHALPLTTYFNPN